MIEIGKYNELEILRDTSVGLFLGDEEGEDVLLPNKYCPEDFEIGDVLRVFVYLDHEDRKVATNIQPPFQLNEFALLKVSAVTQVGCFMDWGMEKELLVPFREQPNKLEEGKSYIIRLMLDESTNRLYGSNRIEKFLQNEEIELELNQQVDIVVYRKTDLGYMVIIGNAHQGLVYENEIFKPIRIGDKMKAYIKNIGEENKIDISLQPIGYDNFIDSDTKLVLGLMVRNEGRLDLNDKSSPDDIYNTLGISKKAYKRAIGALYKKRLIVIDDRGIEFA